MAPIRWVVVCLLAAACVDLTRPAGLARHLPSTDPRPEVTDGAPKPETPDAPATPDGDAERDGSDDAPDGEPGNPDGGDAEIDSARVPNGQPCGDPGQCESGFCAQGVCCASACTETCRVCNLTPTPGVCSPVPAGDDPAGHCAAEDVMTCGLDGTCDGAGACRRYPTGTECAAGSCSNAIESAARTCDGAGTCRPPLSTRVCAGGVCMGASCASACTGPEGCQAGFFCESMKCTPKRAQAATCTGPEQCMSGHCIDGRCCDRQCGETCWACNVAGAEGTCTRVPTGQDPRTQCVAQPTSSCGRAGGCDGAGACRLHALGTPCSGTSCAGGTETTAGTCNGLGVCQPGSPRSCAPYLCAGTACASTCTSSDACAPGFRCAGACAANPELELYWRFEEGSGPSAQDSSSNQLHGSYLGPVASTQVPSLMYTTNYSRAFTAASRHAVRIANAPAALKPANNFTLSVWYRATAVDVGTSGSPVGAELISMGNTYLVRLRPDGIESSKRTPSAIQCRSAALPILDGNWHHVAAVFSATEGMRIYFDGVARACVVAGAGSNLADLVYSDGPDFFVGRHGTTETQWDFGGNLDEVRVYSRALSAAEIAALAQGRN